MGRNVSVTIIVLVALVCGLFWWGWRKAVGSSPVPSAAGTLPGKAPRTAEADPAHTTSGGGLRPGNAAILSESAPTVRAASEDDFWLWDGALLATRSLDDLQTYRQEDDRPPVGYPNGTSRNQSGQTPKQRELLSAGYVVMIPAAARIQVLSWGSNDMAQVRVEEGAKAGATGWINRHLLRYNRNGVFEPVYPVDIR